MKRGPYKIPRQEITQPIDKPYRFIPLTQGQFAIVDAADFEWLSQWNWHAAWCASSRNFTAARKGYQKQIRMHCVILGSSEGEEVDHVNHNALDNRRANLRKATAAQNSRNRRVRSDSKSGLKGVGWRVDRGQWIACITSGGKRISLGYYSSSEEAAKAYDRAALTIYGEFAHLNFPPALVPAGGQS